MTEQPVQTAEDWAIALGQFFADHPGPNINHEKMKPSDDTFNIKERERRAVADLNMRLESNQRATALAEKIFSLKASPGWDQYLKALEDCQAHRRIELELCGGSDADLRVLQGRCRELGAVLALMRDSENNLKGLAEARRILEESKAKRVLADGKVLPQGVYS